MTENTDPIRIVSLRVENFKRVSAVYIEPDGNIVELTGPNASGKSSILDAIWSALAGKKVIPSKPVRKGTEQALIEVDLGTLKVTRKFRTQDDGQYTTSLTVENADGARYQKPQEILDALIGSLSFDPLAFTQLSPKEQFDTLSVFVPDVDFDAVAVADKGDYDKRTEINRRAKDARAQASGVVIPAGSPEARIDESDLVDQLAKAGQTNAGIEREKAERQAVLTKIETARSKADLCMKNVEALRKQADAEEAEAKRLDAWADAAWKELEESKATIGEPIDTSAIQSEISSARQKNAIFDQAERARSELRRLTELADDLDTQSAAITKAMQDREADKQAKVAAAKMPVEGLSFGDGEVLLNGIPFSQSSHAEQIRTSVAIAASMSPKLRIAFVRDGGLLDSKSWALLSAEAKRLNLQVWAETIESGRPGAVLIEDGATKDVRSEAA